MKYVAELYCLDDGKHHTLAPFEIDADSDKEAARQAKDLAIPELGQMIDRIVHLQVVRDGVGVFSRTYGEL